MAQTSLSSGSTIDDKINSLLSTYQWGSSNGTAYSLSYSFPGASAIWDTNYSNINEPFDYGYSAVTSQIQSDFKAALAVWSEVANLTFTEVSDSTPGDIRVAFTPAVTGSTAGYAYLPYSGAPSSGDVWLNSSITDFSPGSQGFSTLVHELGHALGFKHPFESEPFGNNSTTLSSTDDASNYTVMSYTDHKGAGYTESGSSNTFYTTAASSPMLYDIAAIQFLYGANTATRTGDDTYTFSTIAELKTIWDAGGTDTFDISNQNLDMVINLNAGSFSSIGAINYKLVGSYIQSTNEPAYDNIAIAYGVEIENAIGGSGNDSITGNDLDNELSGGGGNDTIDGGNGNDTAVYSGNKSDYTISNNSSGITVSGSTEGTDTLSSIEYLKFNDGTFDALTLENIDTTSGNTDPIIPTKPTTPAEVVTEITEAHSYNYFLLQIDSALPNDASVSYTTRDVTAKAGEDYVAANGTATIKAGELSTIITIEILEDAIAESDETFELVLSNPVGASFPEGITEITASRTIIDDDAASADQLDELIILGSTMDDYAV